MTQRFRPSEQLEDRADADRKKILPEWAVSADDQIVLVAFIALILILGVFGWSRWRADSDPNGSEVASVDIATGDQNSSVLASVPSATEVDLSSVETSFGISGRMAGTTAVLVGTVADAETRNAAGAAALALDGVVQVDNRLRLERQLTNGVQDTGEDSESTGQLVSETTIATPSTTAAPQSADAVVTATDDSITLAGTVPSEAIADHLWAAAAANYQPAQIEDQLEVVDGAEPFTLTVRGTLTNQELLDALATGLTGAARDATVVDGLELDAGATVAAALNELFELEPILFESGTNVILANSLPTLDQAAEILKQNPEAVIEIGGHTDSRGPDEANLALSQSRADAVLAALIERQVVNAMTAIGFGETNPLAMPDDTPEAQQANRRIEFTTR